MFQFWIIVIDIIIFFINKIKLQFYLNLLIPDDKNNKG